jgi:hypothetical protein
MGERFFRNKVLLTIVSLTKEVDEDGNEKLKVVNELNENVSGRELTASISKEHPFQECWARPEKFIFGVLYGLITGKRAWVFNLID